jgi:transposase
VVDQKLFNWVKAKKLARLSGADGKSATADPMENSRPRAKLARVKMERDISEKRQRTSRRA